MILFIYQILLMFTASLTLIFALDARSEDRELTRRATAICIVSIVSLLISLIVL